MLCRRCGLDGPFWGERHTCKACCREAWAIPRTCHLYIATCDAYPGLLKVGRADDPAARCRNLSVGHAFPVKLKAVFPDAGLLETVILRRFHDKRFRGSEWLMIESEELYTEVTRLL